MSDITVVALYHFVRLDNFQELKQPLLVFMREHDIRGTLLLANEGINGTVAGSQHNIDLLLEWIKADKRLAEIRYKFSYHQKMPFYRTCVKIKKEIVTMGVQNIDPRKVVGTYVKPEDWNDLIADPDVIVIDTRNRYETAIGSFKHARDPDTAAFREFPDYVKNQLDPKKHKKVAMFCTGGIRCEKSTAFLKEQGFDEVYHLQGGILDYLAKVPENESLWQGECYVFDNRVSVDHDLKKGSYEQCHACRLPITAADKNSEHYQQGVSCPQCYDKKNDRQRQRFMEREKQMQLAQKRGESHLGSEVAIYSQQHRQQKLDKRRKLKHR